MLSWIATFETVLGPPETTPNRGGEFRVCVALGKIFGVTFFALAPCSRSAPAPLPQGGGPGLGAGGGRAQREVAPKILPRATQTRDFPPRLGVVFVEGGNSKVDDVWKR